MKSRISKAAELIKNSKSTVILTGAGISTESGIPDFRSKSGLWKKYKPEEYGTIEAFKKNPRKVWDMILEMRSVISNSKPNIAHEALVELEDKDFVSGIITQNIDGFHQDAGSENVIELHGNFKNLVCTVCQRYSETFIEQKLHSCPFCYSVLKPDFLFFGEEIKKELIDKSLELINSCDVFIIVGTSLNVMPAASFPMVAKQNLAKVIEINKNPTAISAFADIPIRGSAGTIINKLRKELIAS